MALSPEARLREEDPLTEYVASLVPSRVVVARSRFEIDLNRPMIRSIARTPDDVWGLEVWRNGALPDDVLQRSYDLYRRFYAEVELWIERHLERHPSLVLLDCHSYNHRRHGAEGEVADPEKNPEINVGTGTSQTERFRPLIDRFCRELAACDLDVRENVKFQGGHLAEWVHRTWPERVCVLSVELKKTWMNEWSSEVDLMALHRVRQAVRSTLPGLTQSVRACSRSVVVEAVCQQAPRRAVALSGVADSWRANEPIDAILKGGGRLRLERQLPFLFVHRPTGRRSDRGLRRMLGSESAVLFANDEAPAVVSELSRWVHDAFGGFLVLEVWAGEVPQPAPLPAPAFRVHCSNTTHIQRTLDALVAALNRLSLPGSRAQVTVVHDTPVPGGQTPLVELRADAAQVDAHVIGIEITPIWRVSEDDSSAEYESVLRELRRSLPPALRTAVATFCAELSPEQPRPHPDGYGNRRLDPVATRVDHVLCAVAGQFDWLRVLTPVDLDAVKKSFYANKCDVEPDLWYRPLPMSPDRLRRQLLQLPIEQISDPTIEALLRERQQELDRQLSMLALRGTRGFLFGSLQLYGDVDAGQVAVAEEVLAAVAELDPCELGPSDSAEGRVPADGILQAVRNELAGYQEHTEDFPQHAEIREDVAAGLMVSNGRVSIGHNASLATSRVEALMHHEVGTHVVTWFNGSKQPLLQFRDGLAGYDALQEGLGVLSEALCGALPPSRLQTLAARVLAARAVIDGATFVETYRLLKNRNITDGAAYGTTLRAHRGGGLTKDAVYLRGLTELLTWLEGGHDPSVLFLGKFALRHVPFVQELRRRRILRAPTVLPRLLRLPGTQERLTRLAGASPASLVGVLP